jgi:MYXO-CTERM domain-containing protein
MKIVAIAGVVASAAVLLTDLPRAEACGCLSPPEPVGEEDYAVNQQAEQIIFEVEPGFVTAHVLIQYSGAPEKFAWIVPVPSAPELSLSEEAAFGLLERATAPAVSAQVVDICPQSQWQCRYHDTWCPGDDYGSDDDDGAGGGVDAGSGPGEEPPPVEVIDRQTVGDYETIVFAANEAAAAVQWLQDEGFIVNDTMAPYMQPYVDGGMLFVAAKLVPGADATAIAPLKMRFAAPAPMVPLVLTAVAADPHLTVTTYIYGAEFVRPADHPVITIDDERLAFDNAGRFNYPMVLARTIDEAGGDGFAIEYRAEAPRPLFGGGNCCEQGFDLCGVQQNGACECPRDEFDAVDCAEQPELLAGVALLDDLATRHTHFTRLTTRLSPEEMTFDPMFVPDPGAPAIGAMYAAGTQLSLAACETSVVDTTMYQDLRAKQDCAAVYCGHGTCTSTLSGPACACDAGFVARVFTDLDGQPSVTCVPETPPVDLEAGGIDLPDPCATLECGAGTCVNLNGVIGCDCNGGAAAVANPLRKLPYCYPITDLTGTPGADDFSEAYVELAVCAPPAPACGTGGWLEYDPSIRPGASCGGEVPDPSRLVEPPAPSCGDDSFLPGCGCGAGGGGAGGALLGGFVLLALGRRRRTR